MSYGHVPIKGSVAYLLGLTIILATLLILFTERLTL